MISNPVYELEDPSYVASEIPVPATLAGYSPVGFPWRSVGYWPKICGLGNVRAKPYQRLKSCCGRVAST